MLKLRVRRLLLGFMAVMMAALGGCASFDPTAIAAQTQGKSVIVASGLGPDLHLGWIGTTAFNNEFGTRAVPGWDIADVATSTASQALQETQRYSGIRTTQVPVTRNMELPNLPVGMDADFLLVIGEGRCPDPVWMTNQAFTGIGITQRTLLGLPAQAHLHVCITLQLFDLKTRQSIGMTSSLKHRPTNIRLISGGGASLSTTRVPKLDDADAAILKEPLLSTLRESIPAKLRDLGLR
jgi:hypothetical protein